MMRLFIYMILAFFSFFFLDSTYAKDRFDDVASRLANSRKSDTTSNIDLIMNDRIDGVSSLSKDYDCNGEALCQALAFGNYIVSGDYSKAAKIINSLNLKDFKNKVPDYFYNDFIENINQIDISKFMAVPRLHVKNNKRNIDLPYTSKSNDKYYIYPEVDVITDKGRFSTVVDTGMPMSIITPETAKKIKLSPIKEITLKIGSIYSDGKAEYQLAVVKRILLNGFEVENFPVWVGGSANALGLNFINLFDNVKFTNSHIVLNANIPSLNKKAIAVQNYSDISGIVNKKVTSLQQDDNVQLAQIDTGYPYFYAKSSNISKCLIPMLYNAGDHTKKWSYIFCPTYTSIYTDNYEIVEGVMRVMDFPYHILPNYIGSGFLTNFDLLIDRKNKYSGFYNR